MVIQNLSNSEMRNQYEKVGELVSIYLRGKSWWVHFVWDGKQTRRSLKTRSKKEARRKALAEERDLFDGRSSQRGRSPAIREAVEQYLDHLTPLDRSPKTIAKYRFVFDVMIEVANGLGKTKVSEIDLNLIDAFRAERRAGSETRKPSSPKTICNDVVTIRQLVNYALKRKLIRDDPLAELTIEKPPRSIQPVFTWPQVQAILAAAEPPYQNHLIYLAETGCRFDESRWLTWDDIDFEDNVIHIRPKDDWRPKTKQQRTFPMSPRVHEMLFAMPRTYRWAFVAPPSGRHPERGRQISERTLLTYLKRILKPLGLNGHLHTFKHSFVTHAVIDLGIERDIVRQWVGTLDDAILDYYVHIADSVSRDAMRLITTLPSDAETGDETPPTK